MKFNFTNILIFLVILLLIVLIIKEIKGEAFKQIKIKIPCESISTSTACLSRSDCYLLPNSQPQWNLGGKNVPHCKSK